jgi:hypothetical protein
MAKVRVDWDRRESEAILKNEVTRQELERRANLILSAINHEGYDVASSTGQNRARAAVITVTQYARRSNAIHNTLVKNIGAGRG